MKKPNRIAEKGDTKRTRAQVKQTARNGAVPPTISLLSLGKLTLAEVLTHEQLRALAARSGQGVAIADNCETLLDEAQKARAKKVRGAFQCLAIPALRGHELGSADHLGVVDSIARLAAALGFQGESRVAAAIGEHLRAADRGDRSLRDMLNVVP